MKMSKRGEAPEATRYSVAALRSELARALRRAESGETVEITRRGEPVAVLLGRGDYERLRSGGGDFWDRFSRFRDRASLGDLDLDPGEIFGEVRDSSPGRQVDW